MPNLRRYIKLLRAEFDELSPEVKCVTQNVLIIDDDKRNLKSFKALVRKYLNVYTASNLQESLDVVRNNKIDVIFCDYAMPITTGAEILEEIIKEYPDIKRVVLTGYNTPKHREEFLRSNTDTIIEKPYTFNQIMDGVSRCRIAS